MSHAINSIPVLSQGKLVALLFPAGDGDLPDGTSVPSLDPAVVHHVRSAISLATGVQHAPMQVVHVPGDSSIYVDGMYVTRGVAGEILRKVVEENVLRGRRDFCSREVRLDPALKRVDNFEARLLMLVRRLEQRRLGIRLEKTGRGRFRLVADRPLHLRVS